MDKKLSVALITIASVVVFFKVAFLDLPLFFKVAVLLTELALTGFAIHKLTGVDSFYGVLILRGFAGFDAMKWIARNYRNLARQSSDLGASVGFGLPFAVKVFGWKKALKHAFVLAAFSVLLSGFLYSTVDNGLTVFGVGMLLGLAGIGLFGLLSHAYNVLTVPNTPPGVSILVPGVTLPWEGIFAIAVIAIVHEMAHGVLCYVEKLPLKASGAILLGFIPIGAFVEPDEEKLDSLGIEKKRRILVAGSASNLLFFLVFLLLSTLFASFVLPASVAGVRFQGTGEQVYSINGQKVLLADQAKPLLFNASNPLVIVNASKGMREQRLLQLALTDVSTTGPSSGVLKKGDVLQKADGVELYSTEQLASVIALKNAGDAIVVETASSNATVLLSKEKKMGVSLALTPVKELEDIPSPGFEFVYPVLALLASILSLTAMLNLLIGVVNLIPLFITDGQKWLYYELCEWYGKKTAMRMSVAIGVLALIAIAVNALPWFLK